MRGEGIDHDAKTQGVRQLSPRQGRGVQREVFCKSLGRNHIVDKSVEDGDIGSGLKTDTIRGRIRDEFIADATVTVVLVGRCTWQRKHVDWEIGSSLRDTTNNPRCGLLGIWLPAHPDYGSKQYRPRLLPPRLADNYGCEADGLSLSHRANAQDRPPSALGFQQLPLANRSRGERIGVQNNSD